MSIPSICGNYQFSGICFIYLLPDSILICKQMDMWQFCSFFFKAMKSLTVIFKKFLSFCFNQTHTLIHSRHKYIGRAAGLKDIQIFFHILRPFCGFLSNVKQCSLSHRRQCLMQTVDHNICTLFQCIFWKIRMKSKMRSVSFIHNQWYPMRMSNLTDFLHIR